MKESFLNWLAGRSGMAAFDISERLGETLDRLFDEVEAEYQGVSSEDLDPRYILFFLVRHR